ncbi:MAG: ISL3 family transposase [Candidatus Omnitrophica bacterium]|nr:ISL3 family transposase [Candidatus Omnitrophota bacterium]
MRRYSITQALGLPEYKILGILLDTKKKIHLQIRAYKRKKAKCSGCGEYHDTKKVHSLKEVVVEDLRMFGKRVYLHVIKRRYRCLKDGRLYIELIDWLKPRCRVTNRLAKEIYRLTSITTNQEAGWYLGMNDEKVYRIDKAMLENLAEQHLSPTPVSTNISVDEVAWKKHHRYLTNVVDVDEKVVTWNEKGRKSKVLNKYYESLGEDNCQKIESVSLDGAKTYISSSKKHAVNALIVLDRFHAVQKVNNAIDHVRKNELRKARKNEDEELILLTNCKQRFILLKNKTKRSDRQSSTLAHLCDINHPIYTGMILKEKFLEVYDLKTEDEAIIHIYEWIDDALESGLKPFEEIAWSLVEKIEYVLNWFIVKRSSAISEGFNNKIKRLKRMAYGYRDIEYFKLKIHQHCGYLNPRRFNLN